MWRSLPSAAGGVVSIDEVFQNAFLEEGPFWTTPSAPLKRLRDFFLMSRPPLLYQEGSGAPPNPFTPSAATTPESLPPFTRHIGNRIHFKTPIFDNPSIPIALLKRLAQLKPILHARNIACSDLRR